MTHAATDRSPSRRDRPLAPPYACRTVTTVDELERLATSWATDPPAGLGPLTRPAWFAAAAREYGSGGGLRVVVVEDHDRVAAVAPLIVGRGGRLELLGAAQLPEPGDFAARDGAARAALARAVVGLRRPLYLGRLPRSSPTVDALQRALGRRGLLATRPADPWPTLTLDEGWTASEGRLSSRRAGDLRRARRRAEQHGPISVDHHRPTPDRLDGLLAEALDVEAGGWKGSSRTALRHDPPLARFFLDWAHGAAADGSLRISFLRIDGTAAAMQVAAEADDRRSILKIGHTDAFTRCSPGLLLLLETIRDAAGRGLAAVELLGTVEPWTRAWTTEASETVCVRTYPATGRGAGRLTVDGLRAVENRRRRRAAGRAAATAANDEEPS
jgi:CelD/BcsL family acetyltransferase involved in cellulose biosynthesis